MLEATVLAIDNSEWMRNGDYTPSRMDAQNDAVSLLFNAKTQANPENTVGLMTIAGKSPEVLTTLTSDFGKVLSALHKVKISGRANLATGVQIAQLALKHRQNKNQKQRIIVFVGSPLEEDEKSLVKLAKKLKKNNVAIDVINFGEEAENTAKLEAFIAAVNSGDNSHLVTIPPGPHILSDILISSPILAGEDGAPGFGAGGFEFGVDPSLDPELALALRISMEEERARQEGAAGGSADSSAAPAAAAAAPATSAAAGGGGSSEEDDLLAQALAMSMGKEGDAMEVEDDDDEIAKAIALSMQPEGDEGGSSSQGDALLSNLLGSLPGVDPNDPRIKEALQGSKDGKGKDSEDKKKDDESK
ncbi:hypothetical protein DFJ73DRAFT_821968 [Zopfochytrium polystomum]|nr:hypothetical protein DFJ73DRAFT_821968 [Zopfochytrium polystomum]